MHRLLCLETDEVVAVKYIKCDTAESVAAMRKELASLKRFGQHPNVVCFVDCFVDEEDMERAALVMEFCDGGDLGTHMKRQGAPLSEPNALYFLKQLVAGLKHMHRLHGFMHRDLKPANLLLKKVESGPPRLLIGDLGLARSIATGQLVTDEACGTLPYMAPEMLRGDGHNLKCDMWSVGVILYEMLVGKRPPSCVNNIAVPRVNTQLPNGVGSRWCRDAVAGLLNVSPDGRMTLTALGRLVDHCKCVQMAEIGSTKTAFFVVFGDETVGSLSHRCAAQFKANPAFVTLHTTSPTSRALDNNKAIEECGVLEAPIVYVGTSLIPTERAAPAPPSPSNTTDYANLETLTKRQLQSICNKLSIEHASSLTKANLVAAIEATMKITKTTKTPAAATGYASLKKTELQKICTARNITFASKTTKAELIALIEQKPSATTSASSSSARPTSKPPTKQRIKTATKDELLATGITDHQATCLITWRDKDKPLKTWDDVQAAMKNSAVAVGKLQDNNFTI